MRKPCGLSDGSPLQLSGVTNCCKELHLKYGRVPGSVFENFTMHENQLSFV